MCVSCLRRMLAAGVVYVPCYKYFDAVTPLVTVLAGLEWLE